MRSSHVWSRDPPPPHTRLSLLRLPEMALFGLKLSEPISQIQVLQRGNAQRSANPLLVFSMRGWLGQGHRVKRTQRGPGLRSWINPLPPTVSVRAAAAGVPQGPQPPAPGGEGKRVASDQVRAPDTHCPVGPTLTLITASAPSSPRQVSLLASQGIRTGAGASWSR